MQLGLIGLGRMGGNMRDRLRVAGHEVVGYDPRPEVSDVESLTALQGHGVAERRRTRRIDQRFFREGDGKGHRVLHRPGGGR